MVAQPQTLLCQCRCAVRRALRRDTALSLADGLKGVTLPQVLKSYLSFADLPEVNLAEDTAS